MKQEKQLTSMVEAIIAGKQDEATQVFKEYATAKVKALLEGKKDKDKDEDSEDEDKDESKGKKKLPKGFVPFKKKSKKDDEDKDDESDDEDKDDKKSKKSKSKKDDKSAGKDD